MSEGPHYRLEDARFLTGQGRYVEDIAVEGCMHACFVRSPHAHARIGEVDIAAAVDSPGVVAVLTGADLVAAGIQPMRTPMPVQSFDGTSFFEPDRHPLAVDAVRFVGEAVALVVAETAEQAADAAEMVTIDYIEEEAVTEAEKSAEIAFVWKHGDAQAADLGVTKATHLVTLRETNNRVLAAPLEPRAAIASYDAETDSFLLQTQSQGVNFMRALVAQSLDIAPERLHVVTPDVGGSFGMKLVAFPEQVALLAAARAVGWPVRCAATRGESMLADAHARDHVSEARLALDADGRFLALEIQTHANLGAYASAFAGPTVSSGFAKTVGSVYRLPAIALTVRAAYTNTAPTDAYRGAGKPESLYLMERLVDVAAQQTGIDPVALRRRNLVAPDEMPYRAATGAVWRDADFPNVLNRIVAESDRAGFAARRAQSQAAGFLRGYGLGMYLHITGGVPEDSATATLEPDGGVAIRTGSQNIGQGHETAFATIVAERLGIARDRVRLRQGDSADLPERVASTGGSSAMQIGAVSILGAAGDLIEELRPHAAEAMEAAAADIEYGAGRFTVRGTDIAIGLDALARRMGQAELNGCAGRADFAGDHVSVPNGAYACEVEVDPETGAVRIAAFAGVDDVGRRLNPAIVEGQLQGGIAQGIGAAAMERVVYDAGGQLISGSWMDYAMPRADDLPGFALSDAGIPNAHNPFGAKGVGEPGTIGAPAAVVNAVADAIGRGIEMPATPERVWRALRARSAAA
jgi:carbon-monoxide dehydrogenase large subunit